MTPRWRTSMWLPSLGAYLRRSTESSLLWPLTRQRPRHSRTWGFYWLTCVYTFAFPAPRPHLILPKHTFRYIRRNVKIYLKLKSIHLLAFKKLLTTVYCQEESSVHAVMDEWGLAVQHSSGVNSPVDGVDIQPARWVLVNRIPERKKKSPNNVRLHSK